MTTVIQFEIEESLLAEIDEAAAALGIARAVFMTAAIKHALRVHYVKEPTATDEANTFLLWSVDDEEIDGWDGVTDWGDLWDGPGSNGPN